MRQLATRAQRPEVRAAAGTILNALQGIEDQKPAKGALKSARQTGSLRVYSPRAAWTLLARMQEVVQREPAVARAVRFMTLADQLELTLELISAGDRFDNSERADPLPPSGVLRSSVRTSPEIWPAVRWASITNGSHSVWRRRRF